MPSINPSLIPTIAPGGLFTRFCTDNTLNIRWLTAKDPAYYEVLNRPTTDLAVRSLILSKALDALYASLGHEALYPFLVQPQVGSGITVADVPITWIWSMNIVMPDKWSYPRLAQIQRISGTNDQSAGYTGSLRLLFSAVANGSPTEVYLFYVDYQIDSTLTYQIAPLQICTTQQATNVINQDEQNTISGNITFQTLNTSTLINSTFLNLLAPPLNPVDNNNDGIYDNPAVYETVDQPGGGSTAAVDNYSLTATTHGSGLLTEAAWTGLPQLETTAQAWLNAMNYPFDLRATRTSTTGIELPLGMFQEFLILVPAGDEPSGVSDSSYSPVWLSQAQLMNNSQIRLFFSTYNVSEAAVGGTPSLAAVVFAHVDIYATGKPGDRLPIVSSSNLLLQNSTDASYYTQDFGTGHVVLSDLWSNNSEISTWYANMQTILTSPQTTDYTDSAARIGSYGMAATSRWTPTMGMNHAMYGSTGVGRWTTPVTPSENNRFVCERDQGLGNTVDLEAQVGISPQSSIQRYGYSGSLCHKIVKMVLLADEIPADPNFYENQILPRLTVLLGRAPVFGDQWYNGTRLIFWNGDTWQSAG